MQVEQGQPTVACGQHAPPAPFGFAPRGLGQPADAASTQLAAVPGVRGEPQVAGRLLPCGLGRQGDPPGEQVSIDGAPGVKLVQPGGDPPGRLQQGGRADPGSPRTCNAAGRARPAPPTTAAAGAGTAAAPRHCDPVPARNRWCAAAARAEEYRSSARLIVEPRSCSILATAALASPRASCARPADSRTVHLLTNRSATKMPSSSKSALGVVEVGERGRQVAAGVRGQSALLAGGCVVRLLAAFEPQRFDPGVVAVRPFDIAQGEVDRCSPVQGTCFPDRVAGAGQQADGSSGVPQGLGVMAQDVARRRPCGSGSGPRGRRGCAPTGHPEPTGRVEAAQRAPRRRPGWPRHRIPGRDPRPWRATRRAFLNSSIALPISPKSRKTTPAA